MTLATKPELSRGDVEKSLTLYVTETAPSPIERRSFRRWVVLALLALLLHVAAFYLSPGWFRPVPPPPIEVEPIDPAKLEALKRSWKQRGFLLSKDPNAPKTKAPPPKDARYESDRNRTVEKEMRARQTNVIPNVAGDPNSKSNQDREAKRAQPHQDASKIPLSNLSNFQGLPVPGPRPEEQRAAERRRGGPGETGDQALNDTKLPEGAENMLNTAESVYYSFYARIYEQVGPLWQSILNERFRRMAKRVPPGLYQTQAEVVFDADGNYVTTIIRSSSGVEAFDTAIPEAWRRIPRFPNPPRGLIQADGMLHMGWTFSVQIDERMQWQYMPPERQN